MTKEELLSCYDRIGEPAELAEYAARDAAKELATNWQAALHDGHDLETLLKDVDEVVNILKAWKAFLTPKGEAAEASDE